MAAIIELIIIRMTLIIKFIIDILYYYMRILFNICNYQYINEYVKINKLDKII